MGRDARSVGSAPSRVALLLAALLFVALPLLSGCATTGTVFSSPESSADEPWVLPRDSYPTQRLYRVKYRGPKGDAGFKLALYLESPARYRMLATDLGRKLWSLGVDGGGEAVWLNYRNKEYCRSSAVGELRFVPLADLPLIALPRLLLGRLPAEPAASLNRAAGKISFLDARGQLWNGMLDGDGLEWWSLVEAGEAVIWWRRQEGGGAFSDRGGKQQVSWKEIVREPFAGPLAGLEVPANYGPGECGGAANRE